MAVSSEIKKNINWKILLASDGGATSTFDEAADALKYAKENDWKRLIIVTDHFHTCRALCAFEKVFKDSGFKCRWQGRTMIFLMPRTGGNLIVES